MLARIGGSALLVTLLFSSDGQAGEVPVLAVEGAEQRIEVANKAAIQSMGELLPPTAELGKGWRRRGQIRGMVPADPMGRQNFVARIISPVYAQYWGLEKSKIKKLVSAHAKSIAGQAQGHMGQVPESLRHYFASEAGVVSLMIDQMRGYTAEAYQHPQVALSRLGTLRSAWTQKQLETFERHKREKKETYERTARLPQGDASEARQALHEKHMKEQRALTLEAELITYRAFGLDVKGKSLDEVLDLHAREATAVRKAAGMNYAWITDDTLKRFNAGEPFHPQFARAEIQVRVMTPESIGASVLDADMESLRESAKQVEGVQIRVLETLRRELPKTAERIEQTRDKMESLGAQLDRAFERLNKLTNPDARKKQVKRIENLEQELAQKQKLVPFLREQISGLNAASLEATARMSDYGDHSWMIFIENKNPSPAFTGSHYFARVRNGTAIVHIDLYGSMPDAWFRETLERFLGAADEITSVYSKD